MSAPAIARESSPEQWRERIQVRLWDAEQREENPHFKTDYRQAFVCASMASRGNSEPFVSSSYMIHGCHPNAVWPKIVANRKDKLGAEFSMWYSEDGTLKPDHVVADWDYSFGPPPTNPEEAMRVAYRRQLAQFAQRRSA